MYSLYDRRTTDPYCNLPPVPPNIGDSLPFRPRANLVYSSKGLIGRYDDSDCREEMLALAMEGFRSKYHDVSAPIAPFERVKFAMQRLWAWQNLRALESHLSRPSCHLAVIVGAMSLLAEQEESLQGKLWLPNIVVRREEVYGEAIPAAAPDGGGSGAAEGGGSGAAESGAAAAAAPLVTGSAARI